jgi:O-antigen/teichoic acid export membrane protein
LESEVDKPARPSLAKNTAAQSVPLLVGYLASFISAPIVLNAIGLRSFGIWALTGALAQYAALLDFGVGPSLARFVALYDVEGRTDLIGEVMSSGVATSLAIGSALGIASLVTAGPLASHIGGISRNGMLTLLLSATCIFVASTLCNALGAYRIGIRQMVAPNALATFGVLINFSFSIGAALSSNSVEVYAVANAAASMITLVVTAFYLLVLSRPRAPYRWPRLSTTRTLISFSVKNQMQTAAALINNQTDKIVIALFIGPSAAGAFELANRVAAAARSAGVYTVSAMVPTLTADLRGASRDRWAATYERLTRKSTALAVPSLMVTAALAPLILGAWLGNVPTSSAVILAALSLGYIINTTTGVGFAIAYAAGYPGIPAQAAVTMAVANVILTVVLAPLFGIWGVLAGTVAAFTGGAFLQVLLLHRRLGISLTLYWRATLPTLSLTAGLASPLAVASLVLIGASRWAQAVAVCVGGIAFTVSYLVLAHRAGTLPDSLSRRLVALGVPQRVAPTPTP